MKFIYSNQSQLSSDQRVRFRKINRYFTFLTTKTSNFLSIFSSPLHNIFKLPQPLNHLIQLKIFHNAIEFARLQVKKIVLKAFETKAALNAAFLLGHLQTTSNTLRNQSSNQSLLFFIGMENEKRNWTVNIV